MIAREHTIDVLCDRLELLFRAAAKAKFKRRDGTIVPKFVYLDMEEYRDKDLTADVFMRTLDRRGLEQARAGIALQAYIPDSFATQQRINEWARKRVAAGGSPVTIRLVKGANMEAERVEASIRGWPQAPYKTKLETDANYLRMLHEGMRPENLAAVRLGIASHNLFTLSYGLVLATKDNALDRVQFEMLEGMANHQRRALFELTGNMLLYAPACKQEDFTNAIGYLVRRLDENTGPDNFLRYAFNIEVDSAEWNALEQQFVEAFEAQRIGQQRTATDAGSQSRAESQDRREPIRPGTSTLGGLDSSAIPQRTRHRLVAAAKRRLGKLDHRHMEGSARCTSRRSSTRHRRQTKSRERPTSSRFNRSLAARRRSSPAIARRPKPTSIAPSIAAEDDADGWRRRSHRRARRDRSIEPPTNLRPPAAT